MELNAVSLIARQEMTVCSRSRWLVGFAAVFGMLSLAIAYFGTVTAGSAGIQGFERTAASMVSLVLYLVPLLGLMLAGFHISTERPENELLFSQPVERRDILFGRLLGMFATMSGAIAAGFGLSGGVILAETGPEGCCDSWGDRAHAIAFGSFSGDGRGDRADVEVARAGAGRRFGGVVLLRDFL